MAAISQADAIAEPHDQLGSYPAAHPRKHRAGYGVHVRQEESQLHLAGMPRSIPAGQLWLDAVPKNAYRAVVHHCHVSHRRARPHLVTTSRADLGGRGREEREVATALLIRATHTCAGLPGASGRVELLGLGGTG